MMNKFEVVAVNLSGLPYCQRRLFRFRRGGTAADKFVIEIFTKAPFSLGKTDRYRDSVGNNNKL